MRFRGSAILIPCLSCAGPAAGAASWLAPGFSAEDAAPGAAWVDPVGLAFAPGGALFVAERRGVVWIVRSGSRIDPPFISLEDEVLESGDRGLLGIAVDPRFDENGFVYLLYTVDPDGGGDGAGVSFGRVTRYRSSQDDPDRADPATRKVLIGATWATGIPAIGDSHGPGSLAFGTDGTLLVSTGDSARAAGIDAGGLDPAAFGPGRFPAAEDRGAFRAQWTGSLAGKVLRIDPQTGGGLPSNPYYTGNPYDQESCVWAYGLRNPFRMAVRPGTGAADPIEGRPGTVFIGDVGWDTWEEIDISRGRGGENFGWPCAEGSHPAGGYAGLEVPFGCSAERGPGNPEHPTGPLMELHHHEPLLSSPPGPSGRALSGLAFYEGGTYPNSYTGGCFVADHEAGWIKVVELVGENGVARILDFAEGAGGPAALAADPITGEILCASIGDDRIYRFRYTFQNSPPLAQALAVPQEGSAPLAVQFSSVGTSDPDGDALEYSWSFGDGGTSTIENPAHTYTTPGEYTAMLTVSDPEGAEGTASVAISVRGAPLPIPPAAWIESIEPNPSTEGEPVSFRGRASGTDPGTVFLWISSIDGVIGDAPDISTATLSAGLHSISFFAVTASGRASPEALAVIEVRPAPSTLEIIVDEDDGAASSTGTWAPSSARGQHGEASLYSKHAGDTFSFRPDTSTRGVYDVHAWWTSLPGRTSAAPFTIVYATGEDLVRVNQRHGGSRWRLLGTYPFGDSARVDLTATGGGESTCADAVRLVHRPGDIIIDDGDPGTSSTGEWSPSQGVSPYGGGSVFALDAAGVYRYAFQPESGSYRVFAWWTSSPRRSSQVRYSISHAGGETTVTVNQRIASGQWNLLGEFSFEDEGAVSIEALDNAVSYCADAVYLRKS